MATLRGNALSQHRVVDSLLLMALHDTRAEEKKKSEELTLVLTTGISSFCAYFHSFVGTTSFFSSDSEWQQALNSTKRSNQCALLIFLLI